MSLKQQTVSGVLWTFSQQFGVQLINFIAQIVLARILLPSEFGLIAMLSVFISIGKSLMDSGLTASLIRTPDPDQRDYSTVFFINMIGSIVIYFLLFFCAPLIASFYKQPILTAVIRVYTLTFIIQAFMAVQTTRLTKNMNFRVQMIMQIPSVIVGGIVGVVMAYMHYGVWSLVWMSLTSAFLFSIQHWFHSGWYPSFIIDWERLKHHFKFGYKLTIAGVLSSIFSNIYNLVIGKYFSANEVGFYNRADTLQGFPVQNISLALTKVTFPMFASIQDDKVKLKSVYKKLMQQVIFWVTPLMIYLAIVAEPLFRFVLTAKWLPSVPYFQILCVTGILYPLQMYNLNILNVLGRSDLFMKLEIIKRTIIAIGVVCALPFGIYGLLIFQVIFSFIAFYINSFYSGRMINYSMKEQIKDIMPLFILAAVVGGIAWGLYYFLNHVLGSVDLLQIIVTGIVYVIIYLGVCNFIKISAFVDFRQLILKR